MNIFTFTNKNTDNQQTTPSCLVKSSIDTKGYPSEVKSKDELHDTSDRRRSPRTFFLLGHSRYEPEKPSAPPQPRKLTEISFGTTLQTNTSPAIDTQYSKQSRSRWNLYPLRRTQAAMSIRQRFVRSRSKAFFPWTDRVFLSSAKKPTEEHNRFIPPKYIGKGCTAKQDEKDEVVDDIDEDYYYHDEDDNSCSFISNLSNYDEDISSISDWSDTWDYESSFYLCESLVPRARCQRGHMHCRIQAWDDEAVELQSPMWFRVSFRSNYGDFVELEGDEILDFCSALLEYGDLYIFEVFVVSRNTCTFVDGNAIRGLLQGL